MLDQSAVMAELPPQVLTRIMGMLGLSERMQSAALVSSSWRTAVNSATRAAEIDCPAGAQRRLDSLTTWLVAHGPAAVTSLTASYDSYKDGGNKAELQLPCEQLHDLQSLQLRSLTVTGKPNVLDHSVDVSTTPSTANPPAALSALQSLTSLDVGFCQMQLQGLSAVSTLQRLAWFDAPLNAQENVVHGSNLRALCEALPRLHGLTSVDFRGPIVSRATVEALAGLPALQELQLCSLLFPGTLERMPQSLTRLVLYGETESIPVLSLITAPGLTQLTSLLHLWVGSCIVSVDILAHLTTLQHLHLGDDKLLGPSSLSALAALTRLKHLHLQSSLPDMLLQGPADTAAATASSQLTLLHLGSSFCSYGQHVDLFPAGKQLHHLAELRVSLDMVCDGVSGAAVAACCPNLQRLHLYGSSAAWVELEGAAQDEQVHALCALMRSLQQLQSLTSLEFEGRCMTLSTPVWSALGGLTQLHELVVDFEQVEYVVGMLHLTACCRLTELSLRACQTETGRRATVFMAEQAAQDGCTTIHKRLAPALQGAVLEDIEDVTGYPDLLKTLLSISASAQQEQQKQVQQLQELCAQQRQDILQLQQQVASLQAAADHQEDLQQRVAGLGAAVALLQQQMSQGAGPVVAPQ